MCRKIVNFFSIGKIIVSSTFKILHSVKNINVYVEINHFKLSRFNDNDTGQQIRKLVLKARLKKKHLFSYQFKNFFSPKKTETISSNWIGIDFKMFIQIFR